MDRISSFLSFRKLLRNTRLLILALAFTTLILDSITLSFELNVMDLAWSDVSTQAALLLTPDLLAIFMTLILLIYTVEGACCCFDSPVEYDDEEEEEDHQHLPEHYPDNSEEEQEKPGDHQPDRDPNGLNDHARESKRRMQDRERRGKEVQGAISAAARHDQEGESSVHDRQGTQRRHYHGTIIPTIAITSASSTLEESLDNQDDPSRRVSTTIDMDTPSTHSLSSPEAAEPTGAGAASAAGMEAEAGTTTTTTKTRRRSTQGNWRQYKRVLRLYIFLRVLFSLGLVTLALYWPARQLKPPMGHLPELPNSGERFRDFRNGIGPLTGSGHGGDGIGPHSSSFGDRELSPPPPFSSKHSGHAFNTREGEDDGLSDDGVPDGPNRWCAWEEEFGDNQSAVVYCRVNDIRPAITYIYAILIVVELCIAAMAGDFSDTGLNGYKSNTRTYEAEDQDMTDSGTGVQEQGYPEGSPDEETAMGAGVGRVYPAQNSLTRSSLLGQDDGRFSQRERYHVHQ